MSHIRAIIVDDNPFNIEVILDLLGSEELQISVVGSAKNGTEAIALIRAEKPDLVFLDVEMPDMNGFEVLATFDAIDFQTIFVTAHTHYAIRAIRFNALDYLVKPIDPGEFHQAVQRFQSNYDKSHHQDQIQTALDNINKEDVLDQLLYLPTQEGGMKMVIREIIKIAGDRNYSTFHLTKNRTKISSKTLGHFETLLHEKGFFRCHRSHLVNGHHIAQLEKDSFILSDKSEIPISRRRKTDAKNWYNTL